jgi:hypothetical protein
MVSDSALNDFLTFSAVVTGFSEFRLRGTGQADSYFSTLSAIVGERIVSDLLAVFRRIADEAGGDEAALERGMRRDIFSDDRLGPVARNLIKLWYTGAWYGMPRDWREAYGTNESDQHFVVSPESYTEGLLWPAIGANPSGAKPFGFGIWATPPRIES